MSSIDSAHHPAPQISAIMPARNAARTVRSAIRSVLWQTYTRWELIIVDDGSTDETFEIAMDAAAGDPRVRVLRFPFAGRGTARNRCMDLCTAPYVAICDADDISSPHRFAIQLAAIEAQRADVVACSRSAALLDGAPPTYSFVTPSNAEDISRAFASGRMPIQFATALLRRDVITERGGFDPELHRNQDFGLLTRSFETLRFNVIDDILLLYRTPALSAPFRLIAENNFYRLLARVRASGSSLTAEELRASPKAAIQSYILSPLQYLKHALDRRILGRGLKKLSAIESKQLSDILDRSNA